MFKTEANRRGSLRSLRSAPLLSTVLESTLSLTRIHPLDSLELPGLDFDDDSLILPATPLRNGITAVSCGPQPGAGLMGKIGPESSLRQTEQKRSIQHKRALSRKLKPHLVADGVKAYINRAQRTTKNSSQEQQPNMEFLRGVYAFMQDNGYQSATTAARAASTTTNSTTTSPNSIPTETTTTATTTTTTTNTTTRTTSTKRNTTNNNNTTICKARKNNATKSTTIRLNKAKTTDTTTTESK